MKPFTRMPLLFACLTTPLLGIACAQEPAPKPSEKPPAEPTAQDVVAEIKAQFTKEGVTYDGEKGTVALACVVNQPQDPVEYLLIHRRGKRHEAMFWTTGKASVLNAALLMLGLEPGKNASYVEKDPPPSLEEIERGVDPLIITPPSGMRFWMTVRWRTPEDKLVEHCVEDLLLDLTTQRPVESCEWIFLGGRMAQIYRNEPEVYVADYEGNLISVCYLSPDNHLATMAHERARDDQNWWMTDLMPPPDTKVELVVHKKESKLHEARKKRLAAESEARAKEAAKDAAKGEAKKDGGDGK
jgi:hypothetical protein